MITNVEMKTENGQEELPSEKFLLESPLGNGLVAAATVSVTTQETGFGIEPCAVAHERGNVSSSELFSQLARSAQKAVLRFPSSARVHANLGAALLKAGKLQDAEHELRTALKIEPNHYLAAMTLAKLYTEQGKLAEAEAVYGALLAAGCSEVLVPVNLANIALRTGDYEKAATIIQDATSLQPIARHYILGLLRLHESNHREAIKELKAALRTDIRNPQLNHALGIAYATSGDQRRAEKHLRSALALAPNSPVTVRALGTVLLEGKRSAQAVELIHGYLEAFPSDWAARELLGRCYMDMSKWSTAKAQFKLALSDRESIPQPEQARIHCNLGVVYAHEKHYRDAESELVKSLLLNDSGSSVIYENYARVLIYGFQNNLQAIDVLQKSKRLFPESVVTRLLMAVAYSREDQYRLALDELAPVHSADSSPELSSQLGWLYERLGYKSNALHVLRTAFLKYPSDTSILNNLAYTLLGAGEIDEARTIIRSFPKDKEPHPEFLATQGLLRLYEGDLDCARRLYKRAELMAKRTSDKDLVKRVRQKMHLELAKYFIRIGDSPEAQRELSFSRLEHVKLYSSKDEIESVSRLLESGGPPR